MKVSIKETHIDPPFKHRGLELRIDCVAQNVNLGYREEDILYLASCE